MMKRFLLDESGAAATKVGFFGSFILLLAYGWFHTGGAMMYDFASVATSAVHSAIRHITGREYWS